MSFLQDNNAYARLCRGLGRQQVLAGGRQGQELDLLGSFPRESRCFQHPTTPTPTHPPHSAGTEGEKQKVWSEGERGERGKQRQRERDKLRHVGCKEEDRVILVKECRSAGSLFNFFTLHYWIILQDSRTIIITPHDGENSNTGPQNKVSVERKGSQQRRQKKMRGVLKKERERGQNKNPEGTTAKEMKRVKKERNCAAALL